MSMKKSICFALFILPVLGMLAILLNYNSPVESTIVGPDGTIQLVQKDAETEEIDTDDRDWMSKKVDNTEISYILKNKFETCPTVDGLIDSGGKKDIVAPLALMSRIQFLEILLSTHCINYDAADATTEFRDLRFASDKDKKIVKAATSMKIISGYTEGGNNYFYPNRKISKIEALAILLKLSWFELRDSEIINNFEDVWDDWKAPIADLSYRLGLTPIDEAKNLFSPDYTMKKWDTYDIINKVVKYYR